MSNQPLIKYVNHIPDLITWDDYQAGDERKPLRFRLTITPEGVEVIGDSPYPQELEKILALLTPETIEMMLCG